MKKQNFSKLIFLLGFLAMQSITPFILTAIAEDETTSESHPSLEAKLKAKYGLSDQQFADFHAKGLDDTQIAKLETLSKLSGKSTDEILKMRLEQHMGWGKIAKELGVKPGELGHAESGLRGEHNSFIKRKDDDVKKDKHDKDQERRENHENRGEERHESHEEGKGKN